MIGYVDLGVWAAIGDVGLVISAGISPRDESDLFPLQPNGPQET